MSHAVQNHMRFKLLTVGVQAAKFCGCFFYRLRVRASFWYCVKLICKPQRLGSFRVGHRRISTSARLRSRLARFTAAVYLPKLVKFCVCWRRVLGVSHRNTSGTDGSATLSFAAMRRFAKAMARSMSAMVITSICASCSSMSVFSRLMSSPVGTNRSRSTAR